MSTRPRPSYRPVPEVQSPLFTFSQRRVKVVFYLGIATFALLFFHYFRLQVVHGRYYANLQQDAYSSETGKRGKIYFSGGELLVGNQSRFEVYAISDRIGDDVHSYYQSISDIVASDEQASPMLLSESDLIASLSTPPATKWLLLAKNISVDTQEQLKQTLGDTVGFDAMSKRFYPEASLAAHITGYLSPEGGRYGLEGGKNEELSAKSQTYYSQALNGRDLHLTIDRTLQIYAEQALADGIRTYGARRGEIIITDPHTGKILALAVWPSYDPSHYTDYDVSVFANQSVTDLYEPGSTFKVLTVAAGIDAGVISPDTPCTKCAGPRTIGEYQVHTWDNAYHPGITMTEALEESDNTAMVFITDLLGRDRFVDYLERFGIWQPIDLEVEEKSKYRRPDTWYPIELANRSFGQGISVTSLHLVQAVGAIANHGELMQLHLVDKAYDPANDTYYHTQPQSLGHVISPQTARTVSRMMQASAQHGEAQYIYKDTSYIAGKTGTAEIFDPISGKYLEHGSIASFIGFAPYDDPKYLMLVKFERPTSSKWAAETAAKTWFDLAENKLKHYFHLSP